MHLYSIHISQLTGKIYCLSKSSGFSFAFHKGKSITLSDGTEDVSDQLSLLAIVGVDELDSNLSDTTSGT